MEAPEPQKGDVLKIQMKSDWRSHMLAPATTFILAGSFFLIMLGVVPIWNACSLLQDFNYVFWAGTRTPHWIIVVCVLIVFLYAVTAGVFFRRGNAPAQTEQTVMMLANVFITLFGLFLMISSLSLEWQANSTSDNLLHNCDTSIQTHRLYEYSQVLQNIRATPACAEKFSVEECVGYQDSAPYTGYLKKLENSFRCAGFCYRPKSASSSTQNSLIDLNQQARQRHTDHVTPLALETEGASTKEMGLEASESESRASATYPPTLFSDAGFKTSCDGMAARDMRNFAGDIGIQMFYQGVYLVIISVATGFLKLMGFCVRK